MWTYQNAPAEPPETAIAFVYRITRLSDGKTYFGKKRLRKKVTRKPLKGKKRKRVEYKESDWQTYFGSNDDLKADVERLGQDAFSREVLYWCRTLGESSYLEAKLQFECDVLLNPDRFYNHWIQVKVSSSHVRGLTRK